MRPTALVILLGALAFAGGAGAVGPSPVVPDFGIAGGRSSSSFLGQCADLADPKRRSCYIRGLTAAVERAKDPSRELPRIDRKVHASGGFLESWCHIYMHEVGRSYARRHGITLESLYRYVPRTNDPGCSAGFGMGLVMHLGGELVARPRVVVEICSGLPTRFREYTCVHGAGHAFMRGFHGELPRSLAACETLGARFTPDCTQGAYHDYWISLGGGDGTRRPRNAVADPQTLCGSSKYPLQCWYRYFLERRPSAHVEGAAQLRRLCGSLAGSQRSGCLAGASILIAGRREPADHARQCTRLSGQDVVSCLRGVNIPALAGKNQLEQLSFLEVCAPLARVTRYACYVWLGRTLTVVTDGAFGRTGCPELQLPAARFACAAGARLIDEPLRTFS